MIFHFCIIFCDFKSPYEALANSKFTMASDGSTTLTSNSAGNAGVTMAAGGGSWSNLSDTLPLHSM